MRDQVFKPLLGSGIFTQEGAAWKHSRKLLRKQFVRAEYRSLDQFREHVNNLISHIPSDGAVDLQPLFFNLTLDTATAMSLGRPVYSLRGNVDQDTNNRMFVENFRIAQEGLAKGSALPPGTSSIILSGIPTSLFECAQIH